MITLDIDTARRLAKEVLDRQGRGFRYSDGFVDCKYVPLADHEPEFEGDLRHTTGCYIGEIAKLAGADLDAMVVSGEGVRSVTIREILGLSYQGGAYSADRERVVQYLFRIQDNQDNGGTWGEAYIDAEYWFTRKSSEEA